ncbi:MAG: hypothetical protein ACOZQL_03255 [Myxococcota bacterium]
MILRNLTSTEQTLTDGGTVKTVSPLGLVSVTPDVGFHLLAHRPGVWVAEQPIVPPPPPSSPR